MPARHKKTWKRIKGYRLISQMLEGDAFIDGESVKEEERVTYEGYVGNNPVHNN